MELCGWCLTQTSHFFQSPFVTWFHQGSHMITLSSGKTESVLYLSNNPLFSSFNFFSFVVMFWSFLLTESNFVSCRLKCCSAILHRHKEWTEFVQSWGKNRRFNSRPQTGLRNKVRMICHFKVQYGHSHLKQSLTWVPGFSPRRSQDREGQNGRHVAEREGGRVEVKIRYHYDWLTLIA